MAVSRASSWCWAWVVVAGCLGGPPTEEDGSSAEIPAVLDIPTRLVAPEVGMRDKRLKVLIARPPVEYRLGLEGERAHRFTIPPGPALVRVRVRTFGGFDPVLLAETGPTGSAPPREIGGPVAGESPTIREATLVRRRDQPVFVTVTDRAAWERGVPLPGVAVYQIELLNFPEARFWSGPVASPDVWSGGAQELFDGSYATSLSLAYSGATWLSVPMPSSPAERWFVVHLALAASPTTAVPELRATLPGGVTSLPGVSQAGGSFRIDHFWVGDEATGFDLLFGPDGDSDWFLEDADLHALMVVGLEAATLWGKYGAVDLR